MPSKKRATIWEANPHTIAKVTILGDYLTAWFQVFGRARMPRTILYINGFAGPGEYANYPTGSPIAAIRSLMKAMGTEGNPWTASVDCVFVEEDSNRLENLRIRIAPFASDPRVNIHLFRGSFEEVLPEIRRKFAQSFQQHSPLLAFLDPFGAKDIPFNAVRDLLSSEQSEVLLYLDADGIARNLKAGNNDYIDRVMGGPYWRDKLSAASPFSTLCRQVLDLYRSRLAEEGLAPYTYAFEMRSKDDRLNYYLLFEGRHVLGLEKMKESMKRIDQTGSYQFSDARVGQETLIRFDHPQDWLPKLEAFLAQRDWVSYQSLRDFALTETPFLNPKSMLKVLEEDDRIEVLVIPGLQRRRGTFPEGKIAGVRLRTRG